MHRHANVLGVREALKQKVGKKRDSRAETVGQTIKAFFTREGECQKLIYLQ